MTGERALQRGVLISKERTYFKVCINEVNNMSAIYHVWSRRKSCITGESGPVVSRQLLFCSSTLNEPILRKELCMIDVNSQTLDLVGIVL